MTRSQQFTSRFDRNASEAASLPPAPTPPAAATAHGNGSAADPPRTVIRGESSGRSPEAAFTDWLNITFPLPEDRDPARLVLNAVTEATSGIFGGMSDRDRGLHGYSRSFAFDRGGVIVAIGGQRDTAFVSIPGDGCALVPSWQWVVNRFGAELGGRITRWDGAVDDFSGVHSVDWAVEQWRAGEFASGGNRPSIDQKGNWIEPDGSGRTFYVGKRKNGKLVRVYEKGMQLGDRASPWVRWEVEYHNIDRDIPWDVLIRPGIYVAGAFPCMSWIQERGSRIRSIKAQDDITYARLTHAGSIAYGALINVMLEREGSAEAVVKRLRRDGTPKRLVATDTALRVRGDSDAL